MMDENYQSKLAAMNGLVDDLLYEDLGYELDQKLRGAGFVVKENGLYVNSAEGFEIRYDSAAEPALSVELKRKDETTRHNLREKLSELIRTIEDING